ncbi:MAG: hypothetical protein WD802_04475 [Gemmatimonadaceae bacterium]
MEHTFHTTPLGVVASRPFLDKPDTAHAKPGLYHIELRLGTAEASSLIADIDRRLEEYIEDRKRNAKVLGATALAPSPYTLDGDSVTFAFKLSAGTRTGLRPQDPPVIYDATANPTTDIRIIRGAHVRVSFQFAPYHSNLFGAGMKLKLAAVQGMAKFAPARQLAGTPSHGFAP